MRIFDIMQRTSWLVQGFVCLGVFWIGLNVWLFVIGYEPDPPRRDPGVVSVRGPRMEGHGWRFWGDGFSGGK